MCASLTDVQSNHNLTNLKCFRATSPQIIYMKGIHVTKKTKKSIKTSFFFGCVWTLFCVILQFHTFTVKEFNK